MVDQLLSLMEESKDSIFKNEWFTGRGLPQGIIEIIKKLLVADHNHRSTARDIL